METQYYRYIIGHLLSPLSLLVIILIFSYLLLLFNKHQKLWKTMIGVCVLGLYLLSTPFVADSILSPLELKYPKFKQPSQPLNYIVVLGCAQRTSPYLPQSSRLDGCSQIRAHEALQLYKTNPGSKVIFTGGAYTKQVSLAETTAKFARLIGINAADIITIPEAFNTEEEVAALSTRIVDANNALVTSASHMPRAMYLFSRQGLKPIPAPTDYLLRDQVNHIRLRHFIPEVSNLEKVNRAAHEYYGFWWLHIKEWFGN